MMVYMVLMLCGLLVFTSLAMAKVKDLYGVVILLSVFSGIMAMIYAIVGAADVAFTEAVVGAGASTIFMMALIHHVDAERLNYRSHLAKGIAFAVCLMLGAFLVWGVFQLPEFGSPDSMPAQHLGEQFTHRAYPETKAPNLVTAVLGDYRSFDTMIEASVVLTAALGCLIILVRNKDREDQQTL